MRDPTEAFACDRCDARWYYEKDRCPECGDDNHSTYPLGTGKLQSVTVSRVTPPDVREPNHLGLARFADDVGVIAQLADDDLTVGDRVELGGEYDLRGSGESVRRGPRLKRVREE